VASAPLAVFVVLSDLHFGRELLEHDVSLPPLSFPRVLRYLGWRRKIAKFFARRCVTHDPAIVKILPYYLEYVRSLLREEGYHRDQFDLFLLPGDQVTWADFQSFELLGDYLFLDRCTSAGFSCRGLKLSPPVVSVVPGNHDKLLRADLDIYEQSLIRRLHLNEGPGKSGVYLTSILVGGHDFVFVLVDTNVYDQTPMTLRPRMTRFLAKGAVTKEQIAAARTKLDTLAAHGQVDAAQVSDYRSATKILVAHHAFDGASVSGVPGLGDLVVPHDSEGLDELLRALRDDVDLAVHGHLHTPSLYQRHGVPVVSAGTATQRAGEIGHNGFFLLKFYPSGQIAAEHHVWAGTNFRPDKSCSGPLN
jgi:hypothetical protein